jgi:hypothetical protein
MWVATCVAVFGENFFALSYLYDHYIQLATSAIIFSTLLSLYLYASSFKKGAWPFFFPLFLFFSFCF